MSRHPFVVDLVIAALLVVVGLVLAPGPATLLIGVVVVGILALLSVGVGALARRRQTRGLRRMGRKLRRPPSSGRR